MIYFSTEFLSGSWSFKQRYARAETLGEELQNRIKPRDGKTIIAQAKSQLGRSPYSLPTTENLGGQHRILLYLGTLHGPRRYSSL